MLSTHQLQDLHSALDDVNNKKLILNTAIDVQAILQLLVNEGITTRDEINHYREVVRNQPKWKNSIEYIESTIREIEMYQKDENLVLRELINRKMQGK